MKEITINVPYNVQKISAWKDFEELLPSGSMVLDKVLPGCGMTYYYLHSGNPVILCAPRIHLLANKAEQMDEEIKKNGGIWSDEGQSIKYMYFRPSTNSNAAIRKQENNERLEALEVFAGGEGCNPFAPERFVPKILVSYDSMPTIYPIIARSGLRYEVIMDEAHVLFQDYTMKPEIIERALRVLREHPRVIYASATPIMKQYLERMETFRDLPYVKLCWPDDRIIPTLVHYKKMSSTVNEACKIIEHYRQTGVFATKEIDGVVYDSTEAVFYINHVAHIINIIRRMGLAPDEVNILVAHERSNRQQITKRLGTGYRIGSIPTKGKRHKPFTFCSKVVSFGCDFYSTSAYTYIFADSNVQSMATDIALDMQQIVGRQRLAENVFRNECVVCVNVTKAILQSYDEFKMLQEERWEQSAKFVDDLNGLQQDTLAAIKVNAAKFPYAIIYQDPISQDWVSKNCINAMIAEERAWELRNIIYRDHEAVQALMVCEDFKLARRLPLPGIVMEFYNQFMEVGDTAVRMRMFCDFFDTHPDLWQFCGQLTYISAVYRNYYRVLGTERIARHSYILSRIEPEYQAALQYDVLANVIPQVFKDGGCYPKSCIKDILREIYQQSNIPKTAKATDLAMFYDLEETKITVNGARVSAFKLYKR